MPSPYYFDQQLVVRTPVRPLIPEESAIDLTQLLSDPHFLEAIYLASPTLYNECVKWRSGLLVNEKDVTKLTRAVTKYFLRMSSRCTPFGLFSGCGVTEWTDEQSSVIVDQDGARRHSRLDMQYLCS